MNTETKTIWDVIDNAPGKLEPIGDCVIWATNEDHEHGTCWLAFLDLIGWSAENYGERLNPDDYRPGYVEIEKLAKALLCYSDHARDAWDHVTELMAADN